MKHIKRLTVAALCLSLLMGLVNGWSEIRWKNTPFPVPQLPQFSTPAAENGAESPEQTVSVSAAVSTPPAVSAASWCVMTGSGVQLGGGNENEFRSIASTTKIMTALLALEEGDLEEEFTVGDEVKVEGSALGIAPGATVNLRLLVWGMLLSSGNDAAQAAAIRLGGDFAGFAEKMNQKAQQLGLQNTLFVTPSGLDADGQGSCARDLAVLTCAALQNADFAAICSQQQGHIEVGGVEYWMTNHNRLLKEYDGCIGVKTGFTDSSGRCLVAAAKRGGATVIAVVLCDGNDWVDASALLDWGFDQLTETTLTASLPAGLCQRETPTVFLAPGETLTEEIRLSAGGTGIVRWLDSDGAVRGWSLIRPQQ